MAQSKAKHSLDNGKDGTQTDTINHEYLELEAVVSEPYDYADASLPGDVGKPKLPPSGDLDRPKFPPLRDRKMLQPPQNVRKVQEHSPSFYDEVDSKGNEQSQHYDDVEDKVGEQSPRKKYSDVSDPYDYLEFSVSKSGTGKSSVSSKLNLFQNDKIRKTIFNKRWRLIAVVTVVVVVVTVVAVVAGLGVGKGSPDAIDDGTPPTETDNCTIGYSFFEKQNLCYRIYENCTSWHGARDICKKQGGDLVILSEDVTFRYIKARSRIVTRIGCVQADIKQIGYDLQPAGFETNRTECFDLCDEDVQCRGATFDVNDKCWPHFRIEPAAEEMQNGSFLYTKNCRACSNIVAGFWIGLSELNPQGDYTGIWRWVDGTRVDLSKHWIPGEPSNITENCGHLAEWSDYLINDSICSESFFGFICAYERNRTTLRKT